jgi:four helix bundle protein
MDKNELLNRTKKFALDVINFVNDLPNKPSNKKIGYQLLDSGTSVGANYRAACRGKSKADFIYKIKIVEEEADESLFWLELLKETNLPSTLIDSLLKEANEITAIFTAIAKTSKGS